jgi:hypothetical protein
MKMKSYSWRPIVGGLLLVLGGIALLQSLKILPFGENLFSIIFSLLFGAAGLAFLVLTLRNKANWWAVIPGVILLDLGGLILLGLTGSRWMDKIAGAFFLGGVGLAFWLVYLSAKNRWWALIPAGVITTLAVVAGMGDKGGIASGVVFFLGLALTFALLSVLPTGEKRMTWPWIPAGVLLVVGIIVSLTSSSLAGYIWPAVLILGGVFLLLRSLLKK